MAIINNNVQNVSFLRNQTLFHTRSAAIDALQSAKANALDGTALLARYKEDGDTEVTTIVGYVYVSGDTKDVTIFDVEGSEASVQALREEINAKLGNITSANTVSNQLAALSGTAGASSAETSVEGAKSYADAKIQEAITDLDYTGVTTGDGVYVTNVTEVDGVVSATTATLPSVVDAASAKTFVTSVSEDKGQIAVTKGTITSTGETIVLTDNADGGVNFEVHYDGTTIIQDPSTKKLKVAGSALIQYEGDDDTVQISAPANNVRTVSSPLTIQKVTTGLSEEVKEEYHLVGASGTTIGDPVKIYKDSHIVSITYITDTSDTHYQNLEYVYLDASGATKTEYVDISMLVLEAEFASGLTIENHVARGVVDPASEVDSNGDVFLTVGADGFKVDGIKDEITAQLGDVVAGLDADKSGTTEHIVVNVVEEDGVITGVNVEEDNIANADDLEELSGKSVTELTSTNNSISVAPSDAADGTITYNVITDASKIKMSDFTSTDVLSGITPASSITEAFKEVDKVITENEQVTSSALNDLNERINTVSGDVETLESNGISGITMNGSGVTVTNNVAALSIESAPATGAASSPITVTTDVNGGVTLVINNIDAGFYD